MKTTNKPEVVAWIWDYRGRHMATTAYSQALELAEPPYPTEVEPLIRLADYQRLQADHERLQAECEKLREDAERYRWLRDPCSGAERVVMYGRGDYGRGLMAYTMLDEAIDAAMEGGKP